MFYYNKNVFFLSKIIFLATNLQYNAGDRKQTLLCSIIKHAARSENWVYN
jgi:hypothetical protein